MNQIVMLLMLLSCCVAGVQPLALSAYPPLPNANSLGPSSPSVSSKFPLDLAELEKIGISAEDLLLHLKHLAEGNFICGTRSSSELQKHYLRNHAITCNDGSRAGYYIRKSHTSSRWIVFLEGGWMCFDETSCQGRWLNTPHLMSSGHWPETRKGRGILSWNPEENPFFHDGNLVYVPYCSSDSWSGTYKAKNRGEFSFMGSLILQEVIRDLVELHDLDMASKLYLAGSSAGGTGVLVNLDRVAAQMSLLAPRVEVRGIADSGWFLDNKQYEHVRCSEVHSCAPTEAVTRGFSLWHAEVPDNCRKDYPENEHWRCFFGYRIYPTMKTPVFVVQNLFDEAQITVNNVGPPVKRDQWQYIHHVGQDTKRTLMNVSAVFAPACLSHIILSRSEWHQVTINGVTLPEALKCWEDGRQESNHYERSPRRRGHLADRFIHRLITGENPKRREHLLSDDPEGNRSKRERNRNRKRRRKDRKKKKGKKREESENSSKHRHHRSREHQSDAAQTGTSVRSRRSTLFFDHHDFHHMRFHENQCKHHSIDHCAWPQCNFSCPKIRNPFTGEEMDFIDLLMQFGLDLSSIAEALGMDLATLQTMDHDVLMRLLVQNS